MDGIWPTDSEGDMSALAVRPMTPVSLSRNREPQLDTRVVGNFTRKQLDAAAPLSLRDVLSLRAERPTPHAKLQIRRRIELARKLKYPRKYVSHAD